MGKPKENTQKETLGKKIMVIQLGKLQCHCHYCGRGKRKGMFVEYNSELYCNDDCVKMELTKTK